jgi:hypothetical protein
MLWVYLEAGMFTPFAHETVRMRLGRGILDELGKTKEWNDVKLAYSARPAWSGSDLFNY